MFSKSIFLVVSLLALEATAFWRLPCRQRLILERVDPIDTPGSIAKHVHTIHGGNAFSMNATSDDMRASSCTSCAVKEDNSAYWTPNLYWQSPEGMFTAVNQTGGMLVYYLQRGDNVQVFPPDLRIIAGNSKATYNIAQYDDIPKSLWASHGLSTDQDFLRQKAIGYNCLNYAAPAEAALGLSRIPQDRRCPDGIRAEIFFPSCWDGKNSDSDDHRSHMAYPSTMDDGECPEGYPVRVPSLFFETIWNVDAFYGMGGQFVFSHGDQEGDGGHGDFLNGWQQDVLERAINKCTDSSGIVERCGEFTFNTVEEYSACTIEPEIDEDVWGPMSKLPGCNNLRAPDGTVVNDSCDEDTYNANSKTPAKPTSSKAYSPKASTAKATPSVYPTIKDKETAKASPSVYPTTKDKETAKNDDKEVKENDDPYLVIVTVTEYKYEHVKTTITVKAPAAIKTVTASPVYATDYVKRHLLNHGKRHRH